MLMPAACAQCVDEGIADPAETRRLIGAAGEDDLRVRAVGGRRRRAIGTANTTLAMNNGEATSPTQRPGDWPRDPPKPAWRIGIR